MVEYKLAGRSQIIDPVQAEESYRVGAILAIVAVRVVYSHYM